MAEFYKWTETARLWITFLLALCMIAQTLALVLSYYRHPRNRRRGFENLLELSVLIHIFICTLMHGQVLLSNLLSMTSPTEYICLRYTVFMVITLLAVIVMVLIKKLWPISIILASGLVLPMIETIAAGTFAVLYLAGLFFWLLRSTHVCILRYREIRTSLSVLSIKTAIDALHSGVLFGEMDGFILLANRQMQRLMVIISGKVRRNGWVFYQQLSAGELQPGCQTVVYEGQIVCLLPDESAWMFTKTNLSIKRKTYIQLIASDITQRWNLTAQLQRQEKLLKQRSDELNNAIANIHTISRQRETQKAKMRAHDILGQRFTLMLRTVRSEKTLGYDVLQSLSQEIIQDLKDEQDFPLPQEEFNSLQQTFRAIGVTIDLKGALTGDKIKDRLLVDIIRESVTNAVRHGFATEISIKTECMDGNYRLRIADNGHSPSEPIIEGGGLNGMRRKVEPYGGVLHVDIHPQFILTVDLPGGATND